MSQERCTLVYHRRTKSVLFSDKLLLTPYSVGGKRLPMRLLDCFVQVTDLTAPLPLRLTGLREAVDPRNSWLYASFRMRQRQQHETSDVSGWKSHVEPRKLELYSRPR